MENRSLKEAVSSVVSEKPEAEVVEHLLIESFRIGLAYLRTLGRYVPMESSDFSAEDIVVDCLAELFRLEEGEGFSELRSYFESVGWQEKDEPGLFIALRDLVCSKLDECLDREDLPLF